MNLTSTLNYTSKVQPAGIQSEYAPNQKVLKLHVKVGDRVTEGQLLAELDTSSLNGWYQRQSPHSCKQMQPWTWQT